jgi:4-amino-4-deoxy-L-arabinose transferase-like glycosyltransferase
VAPLLALAACRSCDRDRGTPCGDPFPAPREKLWMALLAAAALVLVGRDLGHWRWAGTPDEAYFFLGADSIVRGELGTFPLSEDGVFGFHPVPSSYYQAAFMWLFGSTAAGWRLSSAVALAASLPFTYLLTRELAGRTAAVAAAVFFGTAQLAAGYAHFGYNNVQVYPIVTAGLALCAWALRRRSVLAYGLAGYVAGLGFYTYYTARVTLLLLPILVWGLGGWQRLRRDRQALSALIGVLAVTALAALPQLPRNLLVARQLAGVSGAEAPPLGFASWGGRLLAIPGQWLLSIFYGVWSESGHFQIAPVVDGVTLALALAGLCLGGVAIARRRRAFLAPAYLVAALAVGGVSPYPQPALTRILLLAPFTAMLAAVALVRLSARLVSLGAGEAPVRKTAVVLVVAAAAWNVAALHRNVYVRNYGFGDGTTSELIRLAGTVPAVTTVIYVQEQPNPMDPVDLAVAPYGLRDRFRYLKPVWPEAPHAVASATAPLLVVHGLRGPLRRRFEATVVAIYPAGRWWDSAAGEEWNLRFLYVAGEQETGDRRRKTEDRRQKTEDGRQKTEDGRQKTEDRRQKTEDRRQKTEDRRQETGGSRFADERASEAVKT